MWQRVSNPAKRRIIIFFLATMTPMYTCFLVMIWLVAGPLRMIFIISFLLSVIHAIISYKFPPRLAGIRLLICGIISAATESYILVFTPLDYLIGWGLGVFPWVSMTICIMPMLFSSFIKIADQLKRNSELDKKWRRHVKRSGDD